MKETLGMDKEDLWKSSKNFEDQTQLNQRFLMIISQLILLSYNF